mmetsp:Transcript_12622/g.22075  ORF Transcript_12622/g.22075 Transcript_12622/m.22075 type:complete len:205 (-) Transcript_12622:714-1328(-)
MSPAGVMTSFFVMLPIRSITLRSSWLLLEAPSAAALEVALVLPLLVLLDALALVPSTAVSRADLVASPSVGSSIDARICTNDDAMPEFTSYTLPSTVINRTLPEARSCILPIRTPPFVDSPPDNSLCLAAIVSNLRSEGICSTNKLLVCSFSNACSSIGSAKIGSAASWARMPAERGPKGRAKGATGSYSIGGHTSLVTWFRSP